MSSLAGHPPSSPGPAPAAQGVKLDELDRGILHELQLDGRCSFREIARILGVSEGAVRTRVKRLRQTGVLRILGFVDPAALGYGVLASVFVRVQPALHQRVVDGITAWPEAMYVSTCIGRADLFVQLVCETQADLYELVHHRLASLEGVTDTESLMEIRVHKAEYIYAGLSSGDEPSE